MWGTPAGSGSHTRHGPGPGVPQQHSKIQAGKQQQQQQTVRAAKVSISLIIRSSIRSSGKSPEQHTVGRQIQTVAPIVGLWIRACCSWVITPLTHRTAPGLSCTWHRQEADSAAGQIRLHQPLLLARHDVLRVPQAVQPLACVLLPIPNTFSSARTMQHTQHMNTTPDSIHPKT